MLFWIITFFVLAVVAGAFGFGGIAGTAASVAQILLWIFLFLFIISVLMRIFRGRPPIE